MSLRPPRPGEPGFKEWCDLADAFDNLGIAAAGGLARQTPTISEERMKAMVDRFLSWPLPTSVRPDDCALDPNYPNRIGTNLLTATEARAMLEHVLGVPGTVPNDPECTCGSESPRAYNHAGSCPHSTPWNERVKQRLAAGGVAAIPQAERDAGSRCQPDGLMFDAFGNPRTRAVRITLDGMHLICRPEEVDMNLDGEDRSQFTLSDVYLSDDEIERLPEFEGW